MRLRLGDRIVELQPGRPLLMGIVNASPDSFSDPGVRSVDELARWARRLSREGADLLDVGGESLRTDRPVVSEQEEIERVVPVVEVLASEGLLVSVDTWRARVAEAVLAAGAVMINDVSALSDPGVADACAEHGSALVLTHTRGYPKEESFPAYDDVVGDVLSLLRERIGQARSRGLEPEQLVVDPGIDLAKTPAESIELLRRLPEVAGLGQPILAAISRKTFVGALTGRPPAGRGAGTLAALDAAVGGGAAILRVHEVAAAADYLSVRAALREEVEVPLDLRLDEALWHEPGGSATLDTPGLRPSAR